MNWLLSNNKLVLTKTFTSMTAMATVVQKIAEYSDQQNHHPDLLVTKASILEIQLWSHDKNKVTQRDHDWVKNLPFEI